jgi:hypothetical protein
MTTTSADRSQQRWRSILLILVLLPFVPELAIRTIAVGAALGGCAPADASACMIGPLSFGSLLRAAITAAAAAAMALGFGGVVVWLTLAFVAVQRSFATAPVRLVLGFALTVTFALGPYLAPGLAVADLLHGDCRPQEAGVGACRLFGEAMGKAANDTQVVQWFAFLAGPVALVMFAVYAFVAVAKPSAPAVSATRASPPPTP